MITEKIKEIVKSDNLDMFKTVFNTNYLFQKDETSGLTLLHIACGNNSIDVAKFLISRQMDVNIRSESNLTPLMFSALGYENQDTIKLLLENNADKELRCDHKIAEDYAYNKNNHVIGDLIANFEKKSPKIESPAKTKIDLDNDKTNPKKALKLLEKQIKSLKNDMNENKNIFKDELKKLKVKKSSPIGKKLKKKFEKAQDKLKKKLKVLDKKRKSLEIDFDDTLYLYKNKLTFSDDMDDLAGKEVEYWAFKPNSKNGIVVKKEQIHSRHKELFENIFQEMEMFDRKEDYDLVFYVNGKEKSYSFDKMLKKYDPAKELDYVIHDFQIEHSR